MKLRVVAVVLALGFGVLSAPLAEAATTARPYDFDGNRYPDLVVGAPGLRVGSVFEAGGVVVLPASSRGLSLTEKVVSQSSRGLPGASETGDRFGAAVASADFNSDGYADLAIGQPGEQAVEDPQDETFEGAVTVVYGSSRGLDTTTGDGIGAPSGRVAFAQFGHSLATGDFNDDSFPDLAVGAPGDDVDQSEDTDFHPSGTVTILSGSPTGITTTDPVVLRRQGRPDFDSGFGNTLAAGDLDADGDTDLVVGSTGSPGPDDVYPGSISYCAGQAGEPTGCTRLARDRAYAGPSSVAVGNMSAGPLPEIAVGLPDTTEDDEGRVRILQLERGVRGLSVADELTLTQNSAGVTGSDEINDAFGSSLALGDIDRDGYADLVVGATGEDQRRGRVSVVHGAAAGWRTSGNYAYSQNTSGIPGGAEVGDSFGNSVTLLDHNADGRLDLTVGAFGENNNAGAITTLRGSGTWFTTSGSRTFGLATLGYPYRSNAFFSDSLGST